MFLNNCIILVNRGKRFCLLTDTAGSVDRISAKKKKKKKKKNLLFERYHNLWLNV